MDLKDKVIVITGASKGLGKSLAKAFSAEGARVVLSASAKTEAELKASAAEAGKKSP